MKSTRFYLAAASILLCLALPGCSGSKDTDKAGESKKTSTEKATEAVQEYGKRPIDKARAAQQMGQERVKAIDEASKHKE